jgi:D-alanyl-D-alanine carboxypeptidase (penicillin-binding protein 5/6)
LKIKTSWISLAITGSLLYSASAIAGPTVVPESPKLNAKGYVLMDYHTGKVLVDHNSNTPLNPASLTKLMTSYVAGQEMKQGNIKETDVVVISPNAWAKKFPDSSKMFIEVGTEVNLMDLYRGLIIQSGNDASVAIAEHVAGSQNAFVSLMNSWAKKLEMNNSQFSNPHGLDSNNLFSTPYDIALLGRALITDLPNIYEIYSEDSFTYNNITQHNRNGLLRDTSLQVDGMKTGYTSGAGYSLASSAKQGDMRLIAVVMGSKSPKMRETESKQLLNYGFRFFETLMPHEKEKEVFNTKVWLGDKDQIALGVPENTYVTVSRNEAKNLTAKIEVKDNIKAPIVKGESVGEVIYSINDKEVAKSPLVALENIPVGSFFSRLKDHIIMFVTSFF